MVYHVFVGTYSKEDGLYECTFDSETGAFHLIGNIDVENPSYLCKHKDVLYGVSETDSFKGANGGAVFSVSLADGQLSELTSIYGTNGKSPCHLCVRDNFIFVSNYSEGTLSVFETDEKLILPSCQSVAHYGSINSDGRNRARVHFSEFTPDDSYLAVCDLGLDKVFFYPYTPECGISIKSRVINCPPGSGPRHLVFSRDGEYVYILTERHNTILTYKYHDGNAIFVNEISTLPENFDAKSYAAAIKISPCGHYLCASNRGHDSIAVFDISDGGRPVFERFILTDANPRDFCFSPDGRWVIAASQDENSVNAYQFDDSNFVKKGCIDIPSPVCILISSNR